METFQLWSKFNRRHRLHHQSTCIGLCLYVQVVVSVHDTFVAAHQLYPYHCLMSWVAELEDQSLLGAISFSYFREN
jgi:hypothetical protein